MADQFQLYQTATIESITWYGRYDGTYSVTNPVAFSIRIFAEDLALVRQAPSVTVYGVGQGTYYKSAQWIAYSTSVPSWTLGPGTYWLSILENDVRTPIGGNSQWLWGDTSEVGYRAFRNGNGGDWTVAEDSSHAFTLEGTVPDPGSTLLLFGISLVGLRAWRKRRS